MNLIEPRTIQGMEKMYKCYPGPFAIDKPDLERIFPGIGKIETKEYGEWVQGNLPIQNLKFINLLVKYLQPRIILEIGTFKGRTTFNMTKNSPKSVVITIDPGPNPDFSSGSDKRYLQELNEVGSFYKSQTQEEKNRIFQLYEDSTSMTCLEKLDELLQGKKIDFAFIDGGHTYENIKHDFEELVLPRLADNGVVLFDDYGRLYTVIGSVHYLAEKAREDNYLFYWYAPKGEENTNEVLFINKPKSRNYDWRKK